VLKMGSQMIRSSLLTGAATLVVTLAALALTLSAGADAYVRASAATSGAALGQ